MNRVHTRYYNLPGRNADSALKRQSANAAVANGAIIRDAMAEDIRDAAMMGETLQTFLNKMEDKPYRDRM